MFKISYLSNISHYTSLIANGNIKNLLLLFNIYNLLIPYILTFISLIYNMIVKIQNNLASNSIIYQAISIFKKLLSSILVD